MLGNLERHCNINQTYGGVRQGGVGKSSSDGDGQLVSPLLYPLTRPANSCPQLPIVNTCICIIFVYIAIKNNEVLILFIAVQNNHTSMTQIKTIVNYHLHQKLIFDTIC